MRGFFSAKGVFGQLVSFGQIYAHNIQRFLPLVFALGFALSMLPTLHSVQLVRTAQAASTGTHSLESFVLYNRTVYYTSQAGTADVPSMTIFINLDGNVNNLLPANSFDLNFITSSFLPEMKVNDSRVIYQSN